MLDLTRGNFSFKSSKESKGSGGSQYKKIVKRMTSQNYHIRQSTTMVESLTLFVTFSYPPESKPLNERSFDVYLQELDFQNVSLWDS